MKAANKKGKAFTIIELLTVISVIALLMAVLMPVLAKARRASKRIVCAAGMKQISLAFNNYGIDNNNRIIKASKVMGASNPWFWTLLPYIDGDTQKTSTWEKPAELWFCPSDEDPYPLGYSPHGQKYTSYALNGYYQPASTGGGWSASTPPLKLGPAGGYRFEQVSQPSRCMLMAETSYYGQIYDADNPNVATYSLPKEGHHRNTSAFFHSGAMNLIFVDGHVDSIKGGKADFVETPDSLKRSGGMFWNELALPDSSEKSSIWGPGY